MTATLTTNNAVDQLYEIARIPSAFDDVRKCNVVDQTPKVWEPAPICENTF